MGDPIHTSHRQSATFDHAGFVAALNVARGRRGISMRRMAREAGLEPSTLQRIIAGSVPDLPRYALLVDWLGVSADTFIRVPGADAGQGGRATSLGLQMESLAGGLSGGQRLAFTRIVREVIAGFTGDVPDVVVESETA